jgi:glucose-1-phosphate cytidylyltransferase
MPRFIPSNVKTVVLCGGKGIRLREYTETTPKVLVEIGGRPILWHIMRSYAEQGFGEFVLALGHLGDRVKEYFIEQQGWHGRNFRLELGSNDPPNLLGSDADGWSITLVDTGVETNTGGRIERVRQYVGNDLFFATYGDGVSDVDLRALLEFHRRHGRIATVTVVRPRLTFGLLEVADDDRVTTFREKPQLDAWINGGFFVFDARIFDYLDDNSVLEREPMERLAAEGQLMAYRHTGFWACMDTAKDQADLNAAWLAGNAPWRLSETR